MPRFIPRFLILAIAALALLMAAGCRGNENGPIRELLTGGRDGAAATDLQRVSFSHQGSTRSYFVHVPSGLPSGNRPAVLAFHGGQGDGTGAERVSNFVALANRQGFVAIFPNSAGSEWNDGRSTTRGGNDDVGYVRALLAEAEARHGIDRRRVFAAGISSGGMMTQRLACEAADAIRGFAVVAANMPVDLAATCSPARGVPITFFNGTDDRLMPWQGGEIASSRLLNIGAGGRVMSGLDTMRFWAEANRCGASSGREALPDRRNDGTRVFRETFDNCRDGATVRFFTIEGGGHTWPGSGVSGSRLSGTLSQEIDASEDMLGFFRRYGL